MTRFFLDTETNGFSGEVLSLALVRQDGQSLYLVDKRRIAELEASGEMDPWVVENVLPVIDDAKYVPVHDWPKSDWPPFIGNFLYKDIDDVSQVFADFPLDIAALLNLLMVDKRSSVSMSHQTHFTVLRRLDVYPTTLEGAVRHNAWWDAMALRQWMAENDNG